MLDNGSISSDMMLLFDEIYIQRSEEYIGDASNGVDDQGQLYMGVMLHDNRNQIKMFHM